MTDPGPICSMCTRDWDVLLGYCPNCTPTCPDCEPDSAQQSTL